MQGVLAKTVAIFAVARSGHVQFPSVILYYLMPLLGQGKGTVF